ncbi:hypothetical protein FRC12_018951 [Ceratobasidium sp. 428]|nr:hypothetical protein FRC12_018951 [Ceratobasidium sp. 428]
MACPEFVADSLISREDISLQSDTTQTKEDIGEFNSRRIKGANGREDILQVSCFTQEIAATDNAWFEIIELLERVRLVELRSQLLFEEREALKPRLNDRPVDGKRPDITVYLSMARDQTFSRGLIRAEHTIRVGDIRTVYMMMDYMRQAIELAPDSHPKRPSYLNNLGAVYSTLFNLLGELEHVLRAVGCLVQAVALTPVGHPNKPACLSNLGGAYQTLFDRLGELEHLHAAVNCKAQAVALTPDGHPDKSGRLSNLGAAYLTLFNRLGELEHIHTAVSCLAQAVALTPDGHANKPVRLSNLGAAYLTLFNRLGELEHIHAAVNCKAQAVALTPVGHPNKPACLSNLGGAYQTLFDRLGELEHIHVAVSCKAQAVALTPDDHPDKPVYLSNLGNAYQTLFERLGELEHIHAAVNCLAQAVALTPDGHANKPGSLSNLGGAYNILFDRLGELDHIHVAVSCKAQAVALTPDDHPDKPVYLSNLGNAYQTLFERLGELEHIHAAVNCLAQAVALTPDGHTSKPVYLNNLGAAYQTLFDRLGELEHLHAAVNCLAQAVALTPDGHAKKPGYLNNIGGVYRTLFDRLGELEHIHTTVNCLSQAVALTPEDDPSGAQHSATLGYQYFILFATSHEFEHVAKSKLYSQNAALSPTGYPIQRLRAARFWAQLCLLDGSDALGAYSHCMLRLPEAVWLGTSVRRRFECLTPDVQDLISEAAAVAILANRCDLAVEWLEQGRCLVWGQILQLRTPLEKLRASHPELADELCHLSSQLEDTDGLAPDCQSSNKYDGLSKNDAYTRSKLADSRNRLIDQIRLKPGLDDFLRPSKASTITSIVRPGVTVILTVYMRRCDAMIIQLGAHAIGHVPLPTFSDQKAKTLCHELELCLKSQGIARGFKKGDRPLQVSFENILATLWSDVVKPVLDHLNITRVLPIDELPHITWCIAGALSFLPIHAAGVYNSPSTILSNLAISSYTPTISSMGRSCSTPPTFSGILAVGHQSSIRPGLGPLPGTKDELDRVEERFVNRRFTRLEEDRATIDAVVNAMADHSWVHFACHGSQNLVNPMNSALHLHDKDLSLAMITRQPMKNAQLAFLSACQTAKGDSELPNEAVHLAAGLLMTGYQNVIATMWSIKDQDAPIVAEETYKCLLESGVPDSRKAAKALHRAVKHLQNEIGVNEFARWVPYIHMGG